MENLLQPFVHYSLHFLAPGLIGWLFFRKNWRQAWWLMIMTMLVDLDHLFAYPNIFVADRCSINFHPLHTYYAMAIYGIMLLPNTSRIVAVGLLFHMFTDWVDCCFNTI